MLNIRTWSTKWGGRTLTIETGRYALQADAACTVQYGDTVVMATVVKSSTVREGTDFFPLQVSFEEKLYAAGKIKGSRFMKREGRPTDESILIGRVVDRCVRPLFDDRMRNEVQLILTPLAIDGENDATVTALIAGSAVLAFSPIPWNGPIGGARIGRSADGQYVLNITKSELEAQCDLDVVVAGTPDKLVMVEAGAKEIPEPVMFKAMQWGCEQLKPVIDLIMQAQKDLAVVKEEIVYTEDTARAAVQEAVKKFVGEHADDMIFNSKKIGRRERNIMIDALKKAAKEALADSGFEEKSLDNALCQIKEYVSCVVSNRILKNQQRLDGRSLTEIRPLEIAVDLLPRVHGSGMFMRGDTQAISVVTLGAPGDVQTLDTMEEEGTKRYMHHYGDAPFTYGEAGPMRGPSRRAIGHGALAERALEPVLPPQETFPYAIRVVSEILGSNGSSSMASTCGSSLSLMAAGVSITRPVAGIAMGLASDASGRFEIMTDLQDVEDGPGGMDFKIAGTEQGITAVQMDTKTHGLTWDMVKQTLAQAKQARTEILTAMTAVIAAPRVELSPYAPRIETILINPEKIGDVIGPGGKTIKRIVEETGAQIDIEQDGRVMITTNDAEAMAEARRQIELIVKEVQAGEEYEGKVVRIEDFGAFVNILPGKDGLVHVSEISWERVNRPGDVLKLGDTVKVQVKEIDNLGRINLSMKTMKTKPEGWTPPPPREDRGPRPGGPRGGGGGFRRGPRPGGRS